MLLAIGLFCIRTNSSLVWPSWGVIAKFRKDFSNNKVFVKILMSQMVYAVASMHLNQLFDAPNSGAFGNWSCKKIPRAFIGLAFQSVAAGIDSDWNKFIYVENCRAFTCMFKVRQLVIFSSNSKSRGWVFKRTFHEWWKAWCDCLRARPKKWFWLNL